MVMFGKEKAVEVIREKLGMTVAQANQAYDVFVGMVKEAADSGEGFRIPDVGIIRRNDIEAHESKNPATGEAVQVPARYNYKMKSPTKDA